MGSSMAGCDGLAIRKWPSVYGRSISPAQGACAVQASTTNDEARNRRTAALKARMLFVTLRVRVHPFQPGQTGAPKPTMVYMAEVCDD
jgi:hypothetical protein